MTVTIGQGRNGTWVAVCGARIVAWDASYSGLLLTCRQQGWTVARS